MGYEQLSSPIEGLRPNFAVVVKIIKNAVEYARENEALLLPCACCKALVQPIRPSGNLCVSLDFAHTFSGPTKFSGALAYWQLRQFGYATVVYPQKADDFLFCFYQQGLNGRLLLEQFGTETDGWQQMRWGSNPEQTLTVSSLEIAVSLRQTEIVNILTEQNIVDLNNLPNAVRSAWS